MQWVCWVFLLTRSAKRAAAKFSEIICFANFEIFHVSKSSKNIRFLDSNTEGSDTPLYASLIVVRPTWPTLASNNITHLRCLPVAEHPGRLPYFSRVAQDPSHCLPHCAGDRAAWTERGWVIPRSWHAEGCQRAQGKVSRKVYSQIAGGGTWVFCYFLIVAKRC